MISLTALLIAKGPAVNGSCIFMTRIVNVIHKNLHKDEREMIQATKNLVFFSGYDAPTLSRCLQKGYLKCREPFTAGPLAINNAVKLIITLTISMNDDRNHNVFSNRNALQI
jgi:hypothetical protein